ncbi:cysteine desulfurase [Alginatibacterium sediminis]|uniref:Probable cysteine desulfurase n=1 Tax=Alginatibacterium sediminis TaxID=2164068 RepID=A0A420EGP1_9ALTE|nr:cysteine desulfurase [Alginatibacterium sediminis]RKF19830.1 cysteine desulfurase [Alginatibacterium sediminis]
MTDIFAQQVQEQFSLFRHTKAAEIYLDNAASTQVPDSVLNCVLNHYQSGHGNVHRASHSFARNSTLRFESARDVVADWINAQQRENIIWTSGTTDAINLIADGLAHTINAGDEILVSTLDHHSNLVPWQMLAKRCNAHLREIPILANGDLDLEHFSAMLNPKVKIVALPHVANTIGCVLPIAQITRLCHDVNALCIVDGAQAIAHQPIDVQRLGCDFYVFSGHKMYAPTGIGVLYGKTTALELLKPSRFGGEMISKVSFDSSSWNVLPYRLEAGTPNIVGAIAIAAAIRFIEQWPVKQRLAHEQDLLHYAIKRLTQHPLVEILASPTLHSSAIAFNLKNIHPQDAAVLFDQQDLALRAGSHCASPLTQQLSPQGMLRISFALYNQLSDIDTLMTAIDMIEDLYA